ncbi:MAG: Rrf2 family transcriptional regulator [Pseudescherichia vulneris]|nr:Rrf2 family transcriptional regulator [Pseudescherichia vulneris]
MKVAIIENQETIWMRDAITQNGVVSIEYLKDGTQQKIIAALEDALLQAKGQLMLSDDVD